MCRRQVRAALAVGIMLTIAIPGAGVCGASTVMDSTLGRGARSMLLQGRYSYMSISDGLMIHDVSDPLHPQYVSQLLLPNPRPGILQSQFNLAVVGSLVYVPMNADGIYVVDVANPSTPQVVGHAETPKEVRDLVAREGYLYAGCSDTGIMTFDLAVPETPVLLSVTAEKYHTVQDMELLDHYLYVASFDVFIYDLTSPGHPVAVDTVWQAGRCGSVAISGDMVYLADQATPGTAPISGLGVLDATFPAAPIVLYEEHAHADDIDVIVDGPVAYVLNAGFFDVHAMDISNPGAPALISYLQNSGSSVSTTLEKHGACLYLIGVFGVVIYGLDARGDLNADLAIASSDIILLVNHVFKGGPAPTPFNEGDTNCVGGTTSGDVIRLVNYVFKSGSTPACPQ